LEVFLVLLGLVVLAIPFLLPVITFVSGFRTRRRVAALETALREQQAATERLTARLLELKSEVRPAAAPAPAPPAAVPAPPVQPVPAPAPPVPAPVPPAVVPAPPAQPPTAPTPPSPPPLQPKPVAPPVRPSPPPAQPKPVTPPPVVTSLPVTPPPPTPPATRPSPPPFPPVAVERPRIQFDWENLIGVKGFSAGAGIALVLGMVYFLKYSIEHGWLQPPVRVLIGIIVGVALLVVCERKAARKYPVTANALDAAAIAILFSTFFAAHALWNLIPALVTFALLAMVTALAVLLSIRRESLFIAVLGLLGGFATPALLSTGENRPIPLFAYLLLLNIGLAWVAYRNTWPILSVLTLVFTTLYQWGWVLKFLATTTPSIAMGIFLIFPVVTFAALVLGGRAAGGRRPVSATFERTATLAAALPLLFAFYFAAVPAYGAHAALLFGFLFLLDAGLLTIAIVRRQPVLHAAAAVATLTVMAAWIGLSYSADARFVAIGFTAGFVALFLFSPSIAERFGRPLDEMGHRATYAAPALLFVFAAMAVEPAFGRSPFVLFAALLILVVACAWRALATGQGGLYYVASFFAIAAQATWSISHLTDDRLAPAVAIYGAFGLVALAVPLMARRRGAALEPVGAGGVVLLASLALLLFLSAGSIAPSALWALGILLAILNAALFIESASGGLPLVSQVGSLFSWVILASWWMRAAAAVGLLSSLAFVAGMTLLTLGGHAWATSDAARRAPKDARTGQRFASGLYLGLIGHVFLFFVSLNREWSLPPWPLFGTLLVVTLATSAASLVTRAAVLHAAGVIAAAIVVAAWTAVASVMPWTSIGIAASGAVAAFALAWQLVAKRHGASAPAAAAAGAVLFVSELTAIAASNAQGPPPALFVIAAHVVNLAVILTLTWLNGWRGIAIAAAAVAWIAVHQWWTAHDLATEWRSLLMLTAALYAVFIAYPLIVGRRAVGTRDPWIAAIVASAMGFIAGWEALVAGGYEPVIGILPVAEGLVMAVLLRSLLRMETPAVRDLGRLALVAGSALALVTVAIPMQLEHQWITIGWALEGLALAWLYGRVPHRGLLLTSFALLTTVFVRLALNSAVFAYEPRGALRILNWYLYTYGVAAAAMFVSAWWLSKTKDSILDSLPRASRLLPAGAVILLFLLLNIEIADFYATGPEITFRFGAAVSQDLTYTIGWLFFGMLMLAAGIYLNARPARVTAVALIAVTTFKCFLYDLVSLGGLYRVGSLVGLAISLALVALALQKYVLVKPNKEAA
jgi:Predicted membrane protein (DUF2339)